MADYFWNTYQHHIDPQVFGEEVERLAADGTVTPPRVVAAAEPESSPIHDAFEWDNVTAGEAWRKQQARAMLGSIRVRIEPCDAPERVFYHVKTQELGDVYATKARVLSDVDLQAAALRQAMTLLRSAREKYRDIEALSSVWIAVDQLELVAV
jgi:hypothetical protein